MLTLDIEIPKPSRYVSHEVVDQIALAYNRAYRAQSGNDRGYPVAIDRFIDLLEISMLWEEIEEPEEARFFANYSPEDNGLITINKKHLKLFKARPDVYCACLGHEGGHCVLRHWERTNSNEGSDFLFADLSTQQPRLFHKSSWYQYGLTRQEVEERKRANQDLTRRLVSKALLSATARQTLEMMRDHFEPEWMFRQAEHFSLCLSIPRDRLLEVLEEGHSLRGWAPIYRLAERFGVSCTMMKIRLEKLRLIEMDSDGKPRPRRPAMQGGLFN
jgi:hypothetical protein